MAAQLPRMDFSGKAVLITGAGVGIGRAIAQAFAQAGALVTISDVDEAGLIETAATLPAEKTLVLPGDLTDDAFATALMEKALERFSRLDVLINNAANQQGTTVEETSVALFDTIQAVNYRAPFVLTKAALPALKESRGNIVNLSSLVAGQPLPDRVAYSASKAALAGLTRALAADLGTYGIRVNAIAPGHIMRGGEAAWKARHSSREQALFHASYPLGRCGLPEEVAAVALFLASDAASFVTGATIPVDGGMSILCPESVAFRAGEAS